MGDLRRFFVVLIVALVVTAIVPTAQAAPPAFMFIDSLTAFDGKVFFTADDGVHGAELWMSDGTTVSMVKDINPGDCDEFGFAGSYPFDLTPFNGKLYFIACDATHGAELWSSDGTDAGTNLVSDIQPGLPSSLPLDFTVIGSELYFAADDGTHGRELWKTDGTTTSLVMDIFPGSEGSDPDSLTAFGTKLFFSADDGFDGVEPWISDGTTTQILENIKPLDKSSGPFESTTVVGSKLLFLSSFAPNVAPSLYTTDGTPGNVDVLKPNAEVGEMTTAGSLAYFTNYGDGLYATDGTAAGTTLVSPSDAVDLTAVGPTLFFWSIGYGGPVLSKSDGTLAGTVPVKRIDNRHRRSSSITYGYSDTVDFAGTLLLAANDGIHGEELWRSDGTAAGTTLVKDINKSKNKHGSSWPVELTVSAGEVYFVTDLERAPKLWKTDGTPAGTIRLA